MLQPAEFPPVVRSAPVAGQFGFLVVRVRLPVVARSGGGPVRAGLCPVPRRSLGECVPLVFRGSPRSRVRDVPGGFAADPATPEGTPAVSAAAPPVAADRCATEESPGPGLVPAAGVLVAGIDWSSPAQKLASYSSGDRQPRRFWIRRVL